MIAYVNSEEESKPKKQITDYLWYLYFDMHNRFGHKWGALTWGKRSEPQTSEVNFWVEFIILLLNVIRIPYVCLDCNLMQAHAMYKQ